MPLSPTQHRTLLEAGRSLSYPSTPGDRLAERYRLQDAAADCLPSGHRTRACCRTRIADRVGIELQDGQTLVKNVVICGSAWTCPVCGARAAAEDANILARSIEKWLDIGGRILLVTRTNPHLSSDSVAKLVATHREAERRYKSGKAWQLLAARLGIRGAERALEVPYGMNGFHLHVHEILFIDPDSSVSIEDVQRELYDRWNRVCIAAGVGPVSATYGVHVDEVSDSVSAKKVADYLSKELTGWAYKTSDAGTLSMLDILRIVDQSTSKTAKDAARILYSEFASAIKGRRRLVPSGTARDLRRQSVADAADETTAEEADAPPREFLAWLTKLGWNGVVAAQLRGEIRRCKTSLQVVDLVLRTKPAAAPADLIDVPGHDVFRVGEGKNVILPRATPPGSALPLETHQHAPPRPPGPRPPCQDAGILARISPR